MSRLSFLTFALLIFTASPASAGADRTTERVVSFDQPAEAPSFAASLPASGSQKATEQVASFDQPAEAPALAASLPAEGSQKVTEQIASFDQAVEASAFVAIGTGAAPESGTLAAWGPGLYDRSTETTVSGRLDSIERVRFGPALRARAVLKTGERDTEVLLGPGWYLDGQVTKVSKGDRVEVTGSKVVFAGQTVIVARSVKNGAQTLTLRDAEGVPLWAGACAGGPGRRGGPPWLDSGKFRGP